VSGAVVGTFKISMVGVGAGEVTRVLADTCRLLEMDEQGEGLAAARRGKLSFQLPAGPSAAGARAGARKGDRED